MAYKLIDRPLSPRDSGHFVWADGDKTVLSDWSGSNPDSTDDGPLVVIESMPIEVAMPARWAGGLAFIIACHCSRTGDLGRVWTGSKSALVVAARTGQHFKLDPQVTELRDVLKNLPLAE